jgi:S1-C subfamily serine protease
MPAVVRVYGRQAAGFRGVGAGIVLRKDGLIVTHQQNVANVDEPIVVLNDGRRFKATVLGSDNDTEIAVVRIEGRDLPTLKFADSSRVRPGTWVLALGNPFGLAREVEDDLSANLGVITAYSQVPAKEGFRYRGLVFLTDAQINPGSYGGALVDLNGNLVALNGRVIISRDTNTQMGVALPVNDVVPVVIRIIEESSSPKAPSTQPAVERPTTRPAADMDRAEPEEQD